MKIGVVPGLYFKSYSRYTEARIPFETLTLCGAIESVEGASCEVIDFNIKSDDVRCGLSGARFPGLDLDENFYGRAASVLAETGADTFLFPVSIHTNGNLFHSLRIAGCLRALLPEALLIFSGLGPSSRHLDLMHAYSHVDVVLRGEAEATLIELVSALAVLDRQRARSRARALRLLEGMHGLTFRSAAGHIVGNEDRALIQNLDVLPFPSLGLYRQVIAKASEQTKATKYLSVEEHIHLEAGRGCPFSCTFCSNTYLWRRRYRLKSPQRIIEEIRAAKEFGGQKFLLHQQLFTANKVKTKAFCEALIDSGLDLEWSCFTRADCVTPELLDLMRRSGCNTVMYGIESASQRMQDVVRKNANIDEIRNQIQLTIEHGIKPQLSYIIGFPEETIEELQGTIDMYCRYKFEDNVESQIGLLVPAGGTEIFEANRHNLQFDGVQTTTWYTRFFDHDSFGEIARHPLVFPQNHFVPTTHTTRDVLKFAKTFDIVASYLRRSCRYAVLRGLTALPFETFRAYKQWRSVTPADRFNAKYWDGVLSWDTDMISTVIDFAQFLIEVIAPRDDDVAVLQSLVAYELAVALINQRLRERSWNEICTSAPPGSDDNFINDPSTGMLIEVKCLIDKVIRAIDCGDIAGAAGVEKSPARYRVRAADSFHIEIEALSAEGNTLRSEELFRQVEF